MVDVKNSVSKEEWETRQDLAAFYRTIPYFGWDDLIFTHISAKVPGTDDEFLINPYGFLFDEITASNLVKVNLKGKILSCLLYTSPSPRDVEESRMPSSA